MTDITPWLGIIGVLVTLIAGWVRVNSRIATIETRGAAEKAHCDSQLMLMRSELVAVEGRANNNLAGVITSLRDMNAKIDRLLERGN